MFPDWVLRDCGEIPVDPDDPELAAITIAIYLEEALDVTVPSDLLDFDHLGKPSERERTVRALLEAD